MLVGPAYPYRGGIAHFLETIYQGMKARGHQVSAVTFTRQYPELLFPGKTQYAAPTENPPVQAKRLIDTLNPVTWLQAAWRIQQMQPDVVVFKYWMPYMAPAFGTIARYLKRQGIQVLCVVHNALPHERRPGAKLLGRFFLQSTDGLVVMSDAVAGELEELGVKVPIRQVNHPVYDIFGEALPQPKARALLGLPDEAPVLLFFGFIRRYKGLHVLLEAMPLITQQLPDVKLVVAGEFYDDKAFYQELIEKYGVASHIELRAGYIPEEEVGQYFSAADLVVQPYVSATQSGVAQIAYHFERPLVVTDVGGLPEVVPHEKAGFVVPPQNPEALAKAVGRFFQEKWQSRLQMGIQDEKKKYSWDRLYQALEDLLTTERPV